MRAADRLLLVGCGVVALAGPLMALQELALWNEARGLAAVGLADAASPEGRSRDLWHLVLLVLVLAVGLLGTLALLRITRTPEVRPLCGRLLVLLGVGLVLLDLVFLLDRAASRGGPLLRAVAIVWSYPLAATIVGLSVARLAELEEAFTGHARPQTSPRPK